MEEDENEFYNDLEEEEPEEQAEKLEQFKRSRKSWQQKLRERIISQIESEAKRQKSLKQKKEKIRKKFKTNWIWKIVETKDSQLRTGSKRALIKANLTRKTNRYILYFLEYLARYAMGLWEVERLINKKKWGLEEVYVEAREDKGYVWRSRLPILVEIDKDFIGILAKQFRIKEVTVRKNLQRLEAKGFIRKIGTKRRKKGRLRMIGSFITSGYTWYKDEETGEWINRLSDFSHKLVYFWCVGQKEVMERIAQL